MKVPICVLDMQTHAHTHTHTRAQLESYASINTFAHDDKMSPNFCILTNWGSVHITFPFFPHAPSV